MLAVVTVAIGAEFREIAALTHPFMEGYASRIGADFVSLHRQAENPYLEKLRLGDYLGLYERVLFLDTDVIVRLDCPDLFQLVPADCFGAWLAHLIHRIAEIRWRAWYKRLESHRDWLSTPLSMSGQNLPCPPRTTIRFYHSLCQVSARRRSPPHSTVAGSVPTVVSYFWQVSTGNLA